MKENWHTQVALIVRIGFGSLLKLPLQKEVPWKSMNWSQRTLKDGFLQPIVPVLEFEKGSKEQHQS